MFNPTDDCIPQFIRAFWRHHVDESLRVRSHQWWRYFEQQHMHVAMRFHFWQRPLEKRWLWALWKVKCQKLNEKRKECLGLEFKLRKLFIHDKTDGLTCWPGCEMEQVQSAVEHLIAEAHECEHILLIVETHDEILIWIEEFVGHFALHSWSEWGEQDNVKVS